jgi:hypothetical protein
MDIREGTAGGGWEAPMVGGLTQSQRVAVVKAYLDTIVDDVANLEEEEGAGPGLGGSGDSSGSRGGDGSGSGGDVGGGGKGGRRKDGAGGRWTAASFAGALLDSRWAPLWHDEAAPSSSSSAEDGGAAPAVSGLWAALQAHRARFVATTSDPGPLAPPVAVIAVPSSFPLIFPLNPHAFPCDTGAWSRYDSGGRRGAQGHRVRTAAPVPHPHVELRARRARR